jgi:hypothetical protein
MRSSDEHVGLYVSEREERDWIASGLVEQEHILAVRDPLARQLDSEASAKRLHKQ